MKKEIRNPELFDSFQNLALVLFMIKQAVISGAFCALVLAEDAIARIGKKKVRPMNTKIPKKELSITLN